MKVKITPKGITRITISLLLFFSIGIRAQESVDLIIWAGQSNAQGWQGDGAKYPMDGKELDSEILLNWTFFGNGSSEGEWVNMQPQKGRFPACGCILQAFSRAIKWVQSGGFTPDC